MRAKIEELDWRETPMGELTLRRRVEPTLHVDVYEVKLGDEFLMSSLFTAAEIELARLGLAAASGTGLDVVVGGLGLGYTARAALTDDRVQRLLVVDALDAVIDWHERGLLPEAAALTDDDRARFVHGDFFAMAAGTDGFDPDTPGTRFHAILLDVDHSPQHVLHPSHAGCYTPDGLRALSHHLHPGGVFALWSNDPPDAEFTAALETVFTDVAAHVIGFPNHLQGRESTNTVYIARKS